MADAIASVSLVIERIAELFVERAVVKLFSGIRSEIDGTMAELEKLRYFLKDADTYVRHGNVEVSNLVSKTKDMAFRVDDLLSRLTFDLASKREEGGITYFLIRRLPWILNEKFKLSKVRSELDEIRTKIASLRSRDSSSTSNRLVSIYGMGGIGKTTLAMKLYRDSRVRCHFDSLAWATVSQDFQARHLFAKILIQLTSATTDEREKISRMSPEKVAADISGVLKSRKCFLILDDIWTREAWDRLKPAFSKDQTHPNISKILITTRSKNVAFHAADGDDEEEDFLHGLQALDKDESFKLFQKKAWDLTNSKLNETTTELANEMLEHCSGLPLAISLLAGLLSTRRSINECKILREDFQTYLKRYNIHEEQQEGSKHLGLSWLLNLSYDDLPSYSKPCLLYFCLFPQGHEIDVSQLCQLWIAEGFVSLSPWQWGNSFETMEDVAYGCLCELVHRCIIQVEEWGSTGRIRTCRIHHLIRDFCMSKASDETFLQSIILSNNRDMMNISSSSTVKNVLQINGFQRLAVNVNNLANPMLISDDKNHKYAHLRSLAFANLSPIQLKQVWKPLLNKFHLLRVLKLENLKRLVQLPKDIGKLKDLRFLSIKDSDVEQLPSSIGYLRYLQTLDLRTVSRLTLPNVIYKLKELRHLYLPCRSSVTDKKLFLNGLNSLQTLTGILVDCNHWNHLARLTNLRRLEVYINKNLGDCYHPTSSTFNRLEFLAVKNDSGSTINITPIILRYPRTYEIHVGLPVEKLPQEDQISPNLVKLTLAHTGLKYDPMATLQKLPNLRTLHLDRDAFLGFEMVCSRGGFPRLESLSLVELFYLEEWQVEEGALPSLCRLNIRCCKRLMTLPDGLKHVITVKEIMVERMPIEFKYRVGEGGVDFYKVKHVPSLVFLNTSK
ncbi:NB-ARC domain, LRR domain containing protein [Parasponia andersonii]|uniref:NB-ARC domain, LRR domain containing protein n=1 Tax=Parasponia andersonii TaxID=3476 RepID=A0A2P5CS21_PARAD|nr:NB-ARC domain, LRR domain containing protein [Parasponia andersonii]